MTVSLTQPTEGSVGWAADVNQNFQDIEDALTTVGGTFADGVTCLDVQAQTVGTSLSKAIAVGVLSSDGECLRVSATGSTVGTLSASVFGTSCLSHAPANPIWHLNLEITRESASQVRVVAWIEGTTGVETTVSAVSGTITVSLTSGLVGAMRVELLSQSPYSGSNVLVPVAPGTVTPGVATMPLSTAVTYAGGNASSSRVSNVTLTTDEVVIATSATLVAVSLAEGGCNAKVWHTDGYQYAVVRTVTTTAGLYRRANGSTTWSIVGSTWTVTNTALGGVFSVGGVVVAIYNASSAVRAAVWDGSSLNHYASGSNYTPVCSIVHQNSVWVAPNSSAAVISFDTGSRTWSANGGLPGSTWGGLVSHFGDVLGVASGGIYRNTGGVWSLVAAHGATGLASSPGHTSIASIDSDTIVYGFYLTAVTTTRLYSMVLSTGATTQLPSPAGWTSARSSVFFVVDDVSDPAAPTINCLHTSSTGSVLGYFQVVLTGSVTNSATGYAVASTSIPYGRLSEGRVEPRTSDVVAAAAVTLTPCSPPVSGRMLLTLSIEDGGSGDTFTIELWVPGASGGRARATLVGTATGGTRSGDQVTGVADGTPMTVEWDCAADGFADSTVLHPAPFVRLYREP